MSTKLPTPAVRNAIAYIALTGYMRNVQFRTYWKAKQLNAVDYASDEVILSGAGRMYDVTEEGHEIARRGSLQKAIDWLRAEGFIYRKPVRGQITPGFITGWDNDEDGRTAYICDGHLVYTSEPGSLRGELTKKFKNG